MAEKQGFVLAFCKAIRVKYFYALQKPSVYAQRFVASNNATHSCDKSHNRWLCPLRSISANASACFSLRLRSAAKNDAPCRFLNALVQIPVVKFRKTKTDKRVCLSVISIGETGICEIAQRVSLLTKAERQPGEPGFTPQAARCTASCKIPVSEHNKNPTK